MTKGRSRELDIAQPVYFIKEYARQTPAVRIHLVYVLQDVLGRPVNRDVFAWPIDRHSVRSTAATEDVSTGARSHVSGSDDGRHVHVHRSLEVVSLRKLEGEPGISR